MREIKFRAWFEKDKRWLHGYEPGGPFGCNILGEVIVMGSWMSEVRVEDYNDVVVEQYTGLHDANGVEIYEGDILLYAPYGNMGHGSSYSKKMVEWGKTTDSDGWAHCKHYEWTVGRDSLADIADSDYANDAYCEVIGNIHENPELLT